MRQTSGLFDRVLIELQHGLTTCHVKPPSNARPYPARKVETGDFSDSEKSHIAGLMRVNNSGEVAAQGLYRGQAVTAINGNVRQSMATAAEEENEHLNWCQQRLTELNAKRSRLDGLWYWGSFTIGALAGIAGDKWSLGFVEETEKQVCRHIDNHLTRLPESDNRSRAILEVMKEDEKRHAVDAKKAGAAPLPKTVKTAMHYVSKIMTSSSYRI